jgi:hypothetical protein
VAECEWLILCDYAFNADRGKLCLIGIFDRIFAGSVPTKHHQAALAFHLLGEPKEALELRFEIVRPTGATLLSLEAQTQLGDTGVVRGSLGIGDLLLPDYGNYALQLYSNDTLVKTATFTVQQSPTQSPQPGPRE